ncbi:MAG: TetR/AcrR family transcriptional regulator [Pseudomonadales bacterium]
MPTTRAEQKSETRRRLLEEAAACFATHGFEGTTTRQIAKQCGVSIGTVFAHFPNKQTLLQAVLYEGIERALSRARLRLSANVPVDEAMATFAGSLYRFYLQQRTLSKELLKHNLFNTDAFAEQLMLFREELISFMHNQTPGGDRNTELVADALMSHYFFILLTVLNDPNMSAHQAVQRLRRMNALVTA